MSKNFMVVSETVVENLPKENQGPMVNLHTVRMLLKIQGEDQLIFLLALEHKRM